MEAITDFGGRDASMRATLVPRQPELIHSEEKAVQCGAVKMQGWTREMG